ncbi:hypothetical protein K437DRAFT_73661 [Tilletiaria anomala UBC 951]|uniref:Uncharacterized protein n=1 Tax=Tilletiaria anomala (strain ATCC 24038 / CBS 436.72 / UBC 951) TaxID=1037660 RepID=A0A066WFS7_TILAU|nr:uncharacterized protein K437DRAFT_73661 [Tilletiaria anomala UBC 951]KDN49914.1 hypothetical protein K437DRAFT_73661 [Tilletiaria anomala UBC 951]
MCIARLFCSFAIAIYLPPRSHTVQKTSIQVALKRREPKLAVAIATAKSAKSMDGLLIAQARAATRASSAKSTCSSPVRSQSRCPPWCQASLRRASPRTPEADAPVADGTPANSIGDLTLTDQVRRAPHEWRGGVGKGCTRNSETVHR